jgi:hypothetical protein
LDVQIIMPLYPSLELTSPTNIFVFGRFICSKLYDITQSKLFTDAIAICELSTRKRAGIIRFWI